jgi:chloramphenicol 3-O phosphotransferase
MKNGNIIFLNGSSSSGKTTIGRALQERLAEPYMLLSVDDLLGMYPAKFLDPKNQEEAKVVGLLVSTTVCGLHRSVAGLAQAGNNVIVDHVLQEEGWLPECVACWEGLDVLFVGVRCPLEVAEKREQERGDREVGTARYQYERVHAHAVYDAEVDTSVLSVDECVERIARLVENKPARTAFQRMREG